MASSPVTSSETVAFDTTFLVNVSMSNITKLTNTNFLMWSHQVHTLLDGYDLSGYLDGSVVIPSPTVTTNNVVSPNRDYTHWKRQDRLLYSSLLGAISVNIQPLLSTATTSAEIWSKLTDTYAKPSCGHILQLRQQIKHWVKGNKSINEYFQGFTTRFDQLALLGAPYPHEDQIDFILEGLHDDYKTVVDQISGRDTASSLTGTYEKLISLEVNFMP
ncbi:PREDICTED: uncharacterized protein LOC104709269 [Camelina sativa]|uniref:Uncharacterized protein LOC104709269 n=1 Tax=Camelina sativa TaxID=90675 RepID=A0ABM0TCJ7_CAMSA|nr:PREDICTED: uncharacterized protein LOC104709269 [Camelina sativa]